MTELEPKGWLLKIENNTFLVRDDNENLNKNLPKDVLEPLYTAEQLSPKVQMTSDEFDEFNKLSLSSAVTVYEAMDTVYKDKGEINDFSHLYQRLFSKNDNVELEKQLEFSNLWAYYNPEEPEDMVEIVPTMKWFVVSKKSECVPHYNYLNKTSARCEDVIPQYSPNKGVGAFFDTKEQAEEWTNPLTEAVLLPLKETSNE